MDSPVGLLRKRNIGVIGAEKALVASALLLCRRSGRINYADALINADARAHEVGKLYTFDELFPSEGLALERPGKRSLPSSAGILGRRASRESTGEGQAAKATSCSPYGCSS